MTLYTPPHPPNLWQTMELLADDVSLLTWIGADGSRWPLTGGLAPMPGVQNGVVIRDITGLMGSFRHLDQQGARQDGVSWQDVVWDAQEVDFGITVTAQSPREYRLTWHRWLDSWDTRTTGRMVAFSRQYGEWWLDLRLLKGPSDQLKHSPASVTTQDFNWAARADTPFWTSFDSTCALTASNATTLVPDAGGANNFASLWNRGDQPVWPRYLLQGPGTFVFGDGVTNTTVTFGPITSGVQVLFDTLPRARSVREINTSANLYPKLTGRFGAPVPRGASVHIPVKVTGAIAGTTKVVAALTPLRRWPE